MTSTKTTISADGRNVVVDHENSAGTLTMVETTMTQADAYGSYEWIETSASGTGLILDETNHMIDANGVDDVVTWIGNTKYKETLSVAQESEELAVVKRLYSALLDRAPTTAKSQTWLQYYTTSGINLTALTNSILSSTEFAQKYGAMTSVEFIEQVYQNALGRAPRWRNCPVGSAN